ncbi:hypothetical protein [Sphingomonas sanguinis]|uniref:Uncharacterized protein n=1 Tax=Sphingomonas sanguinis TaxID=33051 RepID=A0A147HUY2_9SPHN|nr:hypothetical protein [Sphingomonas sanguinis]KTT68674.1 hypothetical protein NS319_12850 [Sphingomonas sanguinis]
MNCDLQLLHWPAEDRASFAHFTSVMADVQARIQAISGDGGGVPVPRPPRVPTPRECAAMVLRHRRDMRDFLGADVDMFGDPAWQIALAAFQAEAPMSDAALLETAGLSPTGTLGARWVRLLIQRDWIERNADGDLLATDKMVAILSGYFART